VDGTFVDKAPALSSGSQFEFPMAIVVKASQERKFLQN
jgi:hypothetical protein